MRVGDRIRVVVSNIDGTPRRSWTAEIEAVDDEGVRTLSRTGNPVAGPKGGWAHRSNTRAFYWFSRPYNLLELYDDAGALTELYVHVASPARLLGGELHYTDHELDVVRQWGTAPFTTDADELEQALIGHDSADELRAACHRAAAEVTALLGAWNPRGPFAPAASRDLGGETRILEFGTREPGRAYVVRPGAYAVIADEAGRVAVMRTPTGFHLPGGGVDAGEAPEAALAREVHEECGRGIVAGSRIGEAIEHVHAVGEGFFSKHCRFLRAWLAGDVSKPVETGHTLHFVTPSRACALLSHASHRWAVDAAVNTVP
ncbi:MAG: NUDIX domain-containing protein [Spirochaetaceae bacterium]|nr:NUDIX domain-containing protein [Spirochaetaceae bacterium]